MSLVILELPMEELPLLAAMSGLHFERRGRVDRFGLTRREAARTRDLENHDMIREAGL